MISLFVIVVGTVGLGNPPAQPHVADFDASFSVDLADLAVFYDEFGAGIGDPLMPQVPYRAADLDADGEIDRADWTLFLAAMTGPPQVRACDSADDCDDHNPCSGDWCNQGQCAHYDYSTCCHNDFECADFDPCTSVCRDEPGGSPYPFCKSVVRSCCFFDFQCDDGNVCTLNTCESGHSCVYVPFAPCCGNGELEKGEECDDGNSVPGDGCDACQVEGPDQCNMADPISDGTTAFSNLGRTTDGPGPCGGMGSDVWYEYTAPCSGTVSIDTFGSGFNTLLTAYDGCACLEAPVSDCCRPHETVGCEEASCQEIVCLFDTFCCTTAWDGFCVVGAGDRCGGLCMAWPHPVVACDDNPAKEQSSISFNALAGNCYKLQVGGFSGAQGSGVINVDAGCCGDGDVDPGEECETDDDCLGHPVGPVCEGCGCRCLTVQESCQSDSECCGENDAHCDFGSCSGGMVCCLPPDAECVDSCECCDNGVCRDGLCCNPLGTFCLSESDCCGGLDARCEFDRCCGAPGAWCAASFECCGNAECGIWGACCLPTGNSCNHDDDCCDPGVCQGGFCCGRAGATCQGDSECCQGICSGGTCCVPTSGSCTSDDDCCNEAVCPSGSCCNPLGGSCLSSLDCCGFEPVCDGGTCCLGTGVFCGSDFECCTGTCEGTCCSAQNGPCNNDDDCCSAYICFDGRCEID